MNQVEPISRQPLHDVLVDRLRDLVTDGDMVPGDKINEKWLTEAFGVSRTPLREALKVLASEGLVTLTPNRGARVAELNEKDIEDVFPVLMALEGLAGRLACSMMSDEDISHIADLQVALEAQFERQDRPAYFQTNQEIHRAILEGSGNEVLMASHRALAGRIRRARFLANLSPDRWKQAVEEHAEILAALQARDGDRMALLLESHLGNKLASVRKAIASGDLPFVGRNSG
ncbi:GntR family transcriptional regulator [Oceanicola sp. D3]|uniref:GntR family transcriptional regulator n=1 Tax=Oceanicola sp. D3 TaxID=2587163 RepID=UPI0011214B91|nr:GntR family transcriptional regulator [Oceanicola sp. D3]QDC08620.1 GntR family transcriptional regulator [Oceanicola sp. D3]